ncbi:hypothetical protein J1614_008882 [Plenodomus biglobosus]|nr:hypothetical protein J1614_008882 [Plenodomus biglobosus]
MRGIAVIIVALLATLASAAPSKFTREGIQLPPGVHIRDGHIIIDNPPPTSGETGGLEDLAEGTDTDDDQLPPFPNGTGSFITTEFGEPIYYPPPPTDVASLRSNTTMSSNDTVWATADSSKQLVDLRMGGSKVHVGTLRKRRLYDAIDSCLKVKCIVQDCFEVDPFVGRHCIVENIVYDAGDNKYSVKDSSLSIMIRAIHKSKEHPDLDSAARDTVAQMFQIMSEEPDNCYNIDFKGSRRTTLCSVAQQILVAFPVIGDGRVLSTLHIISLNYNRKINAGTFNGKSAIGTVKNWFDDNGKAKFAKAVGADKSSIVARVNWVEQHCFLPNWWWDCNGFLENKEGS